MYSIINKDLENQITNKWLMVVYLKKTKMKLSCNYSCKTCPYTTIVTQTNFNKGYNIINITVELR